MAIQLIRNEKEYEEALKRVEELWDAKLESKEVKELDALVNIIEKYEEANYFIPAPDPIEAIKFRMEQLGMEQKDLAKIIGASE